MKAVRHLFFLFSGLLLVSACSTQPGPLEEALETERLAPELSAQGHVGSLYPAWTASDQVRVEIVGVGLGNFQADSLSGGSSVMLSLPAGATALYPQAIFKGGAIDGVAVGDASSVTISTPAETKTYTEDGVANDTLDKGQVVGGSGKVFEAAFGPAASISVSATGVVTMGKHIPRAFVAYVLSPAGTGPYSVGKTLNEYLFYADGLVSKSVTLNVPVSSAERVVGVSFVISELESAVAQQGTVDRVAVLEAVAGSNSAQEVVTNPTQGDELLIHTLNLTVPAGASSVTATVRSPNPNAGSLKGDSIYWNAVSVTLPQEPPPSGGEGCTPGYWRQAHHYDSWVSYAPSNLFESVFSVDATLLFNSRGKPQPVGNPTLGQAVTAAGGGENALARHAVAALLNASSPDVDYAYTVSEIIALVQQAYATGDFETAKELLAEQNEMGCPLN